MEPSFRTGKPVGGPSVRLSEVELPIPRPGPGQVRIRVRACGVCRTDLHLAQGDLAARRPGTVPGHEVVGIVDRVGPGASRFAEGDRIGAAWLRETCGTCLWCRRAQENLCPDARFTGWDADGGYADYTVVPEASAYRLPESLGDAEAAPLLCAGIVAYRALNRAELPPGGRLGIYGFGASGSVVAQVAVALGATVHVLTRSASAQTLALELGAASAGGACDDPPEPLDAAIVFAASGELVRVALRTADRGGVLAPAGDPPAGLPCLDHRREHFLAQQVRGGVRANTRAEGEDFLHLAAALNIVPAVHTRPLGQARATLTDLATGAYDGAAVLIP